MYIDINDNTTFRHIQEVFSELLSLPAVRGLPETP